MTKKKDDKVTDAGAVELDENELDNVTGGASQFLKLDHGGGDSRVFGKIPDIKGIDREGAKNWNGKDKFPQK